ncbi:MAG: glucosyltransferase domain-containing protein [Spirochaetaceae bacterium]|nr:glucosyltransferase domain-containing protein [Spirochaetaceae bacterium]
MENLQNDNPFSGKKSFLGGEGASFNGFIDFCRRNTPLVITVTLAALFVYGVVLFNISVTGDNAMSFYDPDYMLFDTFRIGRWVIPILVKLLFIKESGVYASNFISVLFIWLFSLLFCYFIAVFTKNTERRSGFIPPALIVLTYSVWPQYFSAFIHHKIHALFICVILIEVYMLFDGFLSRNKIKVLMGFVLTFISFGVYQPLVPLFLCITFIYFILLCENSNLPSKEYAPLCLKLFIAFAAALSLSVITAKIIQSLLETSSTDYVSKHMIWKHISIKSIKSIIGGILGQGYIVTIGMLPFVHAFFSPIMTYMYGGDYGTFGPIPELVFNNARTVGSLLLLPAAIVFLVMICINAKKSVPKGGRLLYTLAGFGVPCSILFLAAVSGEIIGVRILYALPFASAFMFYYVAGAQKTVLRRVLYCAILGTAFYQAQISQNILETTVRASGQDALIAFDIGGRIEDVLENGEKLPVAYTGKFEHPLKNQALLNSNDFGASNFLAWTPAYKTYLGARVRPFMGIHGFDYDEPSPEQVERAYEASLDMPAYPASGCVKNLGDVVVVKMGD